MFRASSCSSSGAYQLQQQPPLVYRRNVVVAVLLVVVGPAAGRPDHDFIIDLYSECNGLHHMPQVQVPFFMLLVVFFLFWPG